MEDANPGRVYLYPEGAFYKAYQKSAWLLCTRVHPFKVSARPLKGLDGPLLNEGYYIRHTLIYRQRHFSNQTT